MSRLVLLVTTPRAAPGLLSWPAWESLRGAARVVVREAGHPLTPYVESAGVSVQVLDLAGDRELAGKLVELARAEPAPVVYLAGPDGDPGLSAQLAAVLHSSGGVGAGAKTDGMAQAGADVATTADDGAQPEVEVEVEVLSGSWDLPGARLLDLVAVMDRLRSPGGCPWDAAQTHESLLPYLLEEAYETVETIEAGDLLGLQEELGDLLLQVVFHARLGQDHPQQPWSVDDVAAGIVAKLVRRHPHVFADAHAPTAQQVEANWEQLKAAEKQRSSAVDGVPLAQPALSLAAKLMSRADKAGVGVPVPEPDLDADDLGELLLSVVALARRRGVNPEAALRAASRSYAQRVRAAEARGTATVESR